VTLFQVNVPVVSGVVEAEYAESRSEIERERLQGHAPGDS